MRMKRDNWFSGNSRKVLYTWFLGLFACFLVFGSVLFGAYTGSLAFASSPEEWSYQGTQKCKKCHIKQYKGWSQTKMAKAFELLKPGVRAEEKKSVGLDPEKDYTKDETCIPCHTTGYGKSGGFTSLEETPELVGVGCEVCHGPGGGYLREGYMTMKNKMYKRSELIEAGLVIPDASTCTALCHNENSPFFKADQPFDWEKRKSEGTHEHLPLKYDHDG
jgi:hypothetical protein